MTSVSDDLDADSPKNRLELEQKIPPGLRTLGGEMTTVAGEHPAKGVDPEAALSRRRPRGQFKLLPQECEDALREVIGL